MYGRATAFVLASRIVSGCSTTDWAYEAIGIKSYLNKTKCVFYKHSRTLTNLPDFPGCSVKEMLLNLVTIWPVNELSMHYRKDTTLSWNISRAHHKRSCLEIVNGVLISQPPARFGKQLNNLLALEFKTSFFKQTRPFYPFSNSQTPKLETWIWNIPVG